MRDLMAVVKALADENRLRVLVFLGDGELCVCQIIELLGLAPSTVSKHLTILYQAGLLDSRKQGRWVHYRLARAGSPAVREAIRFVRKCLKDDPLTLRDGRRVKQVCRMSLEELCCRYKASASE